VAVDNVIVYFFLLGKIQKVGEKFLQIPPEAILIIRDLGTSLQMDYSDPFSKIDHSRNCGMLGTGKDVYRKSPFPQLPAEFPHINIHPSALFSSQQSQGATVSADHSYTPQDDPPLPIYFWFIPDYYGQAI